MKYVPLNTKRGTRNKNLFAIVDDEDYDELMKYNWRSYRGKNTLYAARVEKIDGKLKLIPMHHHIMKVIGMGIQVDHKFHNGLDNQKIHLRICTNQQNCMSKAKHKIKTSKYKGVHYEKPRLRVGKTKSWMTKEKWRSCIRANYKAISLGYYKTEIEAARAYDKAAIKYFGEWAYLNFPLSDYVAE